MASSFAQQMVAKYREALLAAPAGAASVRMADGSSVSYGDLEAKLAYWTARADAEAAGRRPGGFFEVPVVPAGARCDPRRGR